MAAGLGPERTAQWLSDSFELAEFAVAPSAQGQGVGRQLHDRLLGAIPHRTAVLSTLQVETVAQGLYLRRGWQVLLAPFYFGGGTQPYMVMGREMDDSGRWSQG